MSRIPCKKCPQCGLFHDFSVEECECGKNLSGVGAQIVETGELPVEQYGEIDTARKVYMQKCSACGAVNYTDDPAHPVRVCYNCHKARIAAIVPVAYVEEALDADGGEPKDEAAPAGGKAVIAPALRDSEDPGRALRVDAAPAAEDDEDDDDDNAAQWQGILGNIRKTAGAAPAASPEKPTQQGAKSAPVTAAAPVTPPAPDDDDDDDDVGDWSGILGLGAKQDTAAVKAPAAERVAVPKREKSITLTAIRYGRLSFTVEAGERAYMLGRSANQSDFLSQDTRVGNEHCCLFYENGSWFVKDNHSRNGTAVNARDIGLDGECRLSDGDELKLGHHGDSAAFRVTIG